MSDLIGRSLGRYHILEQLGEGGMAIVYKAYDTHLETEVAVKVIRTENILPSVLHRALKRFEREAKALARLTHPNIVKVTDYGEYEGKPYLVMPYLPGGTLKQKLGRPIPWQEAVQLLCPIAEALDYAHKQNIVHRDVKPSNILLTQQGQPMLTDFGIAKVLDWEETMELTGTSSAVGTPEYMAPEQATAKTVDHRADIYALGIVFHEMITGRKPYTADTPLAVLFKHVSDPLPRPKQFVLSLPDDIEKVLLKALAKKPDDRYQSMEELEGAFQKILGGQLEKSVVRGKAERQDVQTIVRTRTLAQSFNTLKSILPGAKPSFRIGGIVGVMLILFWIGSWAMPRLSTFVPTTAFSPSPSPSSIVTSSHFQIYPTRTLGPKETSTPIPLASTEAVTALPATANVSSSSDSTKISPIDEAKMVLIPSSRGVDPFWMDQTPVTVSMFEKFVLAMNYQTDAEKSGLGFVWTELGEVRANPEVYWSAYTGYEWKLLGGVNWKSPRIEDAGNWHGEDYWVSQVSWNDAKAYCKWAGKDLLLLEEWELARENENAFEYFLGRTAEWGEDKTGGIYRIVLGYERGNGYGIAPFTAQGFVEYRSANILTFRCKGY